MHCDKCGKYMNSLFTTIYQNTEGRPVCSRCFNLYYSDAMWKRYVQHTKENFANLARDMNKLLNGEHYRDADDDDEYDKDDDYDSDNDYDEDDDDDDYESDDDDDYEDDYDDDDYDSDDSDDDLQNVEMKLERLKRLLDKGLISESDYDNKKSEILDEI